MLAADYGVQVSSSTPLPNIGAPATGALRNAGFYSLEDLEGVSRAMLLALHGVGPRAISLLDEAMAAIALSLSD